MNKKHWNTVEIESGIPEAELRRMIDHSYDLVAQSLPRANRSRKPRAVARRRSAIARRRARC
jgi:predicted DNA-binding protein (MmcQ/YjbR family)